MYAEHLDETPEGELSARTNVGEHTCAHIRLNRSALVAWRQERRLVAADLTVLQAIVRDLGLELKTASAPDFQDELNLHIRGAGHNDRAQAPTIITNLTGLKTLPVSFRGQPVFGPNFFISTSARKFNRLQITIHKIRTPVCYS